MHRLRFAAVVVSALLACHAAFSQPPQVTIDGNSGPARIGITNGQIGATYNIESASSLTATVWDLQITAQLTNSVQNWFDASATSATQRFYRAVKLGVPPAEWGTDFQLIDQLGRSRRLYYHADDTNVLAVVIIFTGNGCQKVRDMMPVIKALTNRFTPQRVSFWLVDANQADNRSNILVEAISLGISNNPPVLHDAAQLVARTYNATTTPEAVAINMGDASVFYRGAIDDRIGSNAVATTQYYLSNALVNFLAGGLVSPSRTRPAGCDISFTSIPTPSYSTDIAPLLLDKCVWCHSPGNIAFWAMTNYTVISNYAASIKQEVLSGRMPPWHADPYYNTFTNDSSLKPDEAKKLVQWIDDGAYKSPAEPDPLATVPPQTNYPFAWPASLGTPSNIITIPEQSIPASGTIAYLTPYVLYTGPTVWLRAAILLPGTIPVVHHILAVYGANSSLLTGYVPGANLGVFPPGTGMLLTNGTLLVFQMHYIARGYATTDTSQLGLYTTPIAPAYPLVQTLYSGSFSIPPNKNDYQSVKQFSPFTTNIWLYEMSPHMHTRGSRFKFEAFYTNNTSEVLLSVPHYEFSWQTAYRLAQPKYLPKGTYLKYTAGWDNSVLNSGLMEAYIDYSTVPPTTNSLYSPNRTVGYGDQTWDEMFIGYLSYSVAP